MLLKNKITQHGSSTSSVFQFIPVFWNTETKPGLAVTPTLGFTPTCLDDGSSFFCNEHSSPGIFFPVKSYQCELGA